MAQTFSKTQIEQIGYIVKAEIGFHETKEMQTFDEIVRTTGKQAFVDVLNEKTIVVNSGINETNSLVGHVIESRKDIHEIKELLKPLQELKARHEKRRVAIDYFIGTPPVKFVVYIYSQIPVRWRILIWFLTLYVVIKLIEPDMDSHVGKVLDAGLTAIKSLLVR